MRKYTPEEDAVMQQMADYPPLDIATRLGRNVHSVQNRLLYLAMTPEQRARRNAHKQKVRIAEKSGPTFVNHYADRAKPTPEMLADRDRRMARPFSLSIDLLGEPEPGRSALARRASGAPI